MEHAHQHYSDIKIEKEQHKKMKLHPNIPK